MSSPSKRREMDVMKLMMSDYKVEMVNDGMSEFYVEFHGPRDSPYQDGTWKLLLYPNPTDPLNGEAAALMMRDRENYEQKVKEYCERYAKAEDAGTRTEATSSDGEVSDEEYMSSDEDMAGHADP